MFNFTLHRRMLVWGMTGDPKCFCVHSAGHYLSWFKSDKTQARRGEHRAGLNLFAEYAKYAEL